MDSEKHHHVQELIKQGRSPNDEGPFYHHTFWESYKGSIKGKLGGLVAGGLVGAAVGLALFPVLAAAGVSIAPLALIGGLSAAGMLYANKEFGEVGRITGAVAAAHKDAEDRMQEFEKAQFSEIKQEINELKASVTRKPVTATMPASPVSAESNSPSCDEVEAKLDNYRTTHHDPSIPKPKNNGLVFWKVAAVGLVVGAATGLLLSAVGALGGLANLLGPTLAPIIGSNMSAALTGGVIGASFGINRDTFRKVFDKTDLLFKGMFKFVSPEKAPQKTLEQPVLNASKERPQVSTLVYPDAGIDYPTSDTFHRDQLAARANQVLASLDHTSVSRH